MILEFFSGIAVSISFLLGLRVFKILNAVNDWVISVSKFIYFSGHPVLNEDEIHQRIKNLFSQLLKSFLMFLFLIIMFLIFIVSVIGILSSFNLGFGERHITLIDIESNFLKLIQSYWFILGTLIPLLLLPFFKSKVKKSYNYSSVDKFLHYAFLGNKHIALILFKIELWIHRKDLKGNGQSKNLYVSGLARSGTTALMQTIGQLNNFESLSYRNLPFLMLTKTWSNTNKTKKVKETERFHKDGVMHSLNSYEAIEEGFWRVMLGNQFIKENLLQSHKVKDNVFYYYYQFRKLVAGKKIYLAKNNNHLLRAKSIHAHDQKMGNITVTLIPFRNPITQAKSLLKQHKQLIKLQQEDDFSLDYMDFLVHHEFGINQKVSNLGEDDVVFRSNSDINSIEYWMDVWFFFYSKAYELYSNEENFSFFCYENYAINPIESVESLVRVLDFTNIDLKTISISKYSRFQDEKLDSIDKKFSVLYAKLKLVSIN